MRFLHYIIILILLLMGACGPQIPTGYRTDTQKRFTEEELNYFFHIGICPEFGSCTNMVQKWTGAVRVQLHGHYTPADERELNDIISELSQLTGLSITRVTEKANVNIYIIPRSQFTTYIPQYDPSNPQEGLFYVQQNNNSVYYKATICIKHDITERKKHHLLREEFTQIFGLPGDSYTYTNSVFQQNPNFMPTEYSYIDKRVIQLLYDPRVKPGMTEQEVTQALNQPVSLASAAP